MFKKNFLIKSFLILLVMALLSACSSGNNVNTSSNEDNNNVSNPDAKAVLYYFWGDGCPHCATQKVFLEQMKNKYPDLEIKMFETWKDRANAQMLQEMAEAYGTRAMGVPMTFIGDFAPTVGFSSQTEKGMEDQIIFCLDQGCPDPGLKIIN